MPDIRDPDTGRLASNVWLAPGFMAQRIVPMPAVDGVQGVHGLACDLVLLTHRAH